MAAMFCQSTATIFELFQDIIGTNLVTKFHEDRTINVGSRVLTRQNAPPPGCHVFQPTGTIFEFVQDIIGTNLNKFHDDSRKHIIRTNLVTKFHENRTINLASRVDQEGLKGPKKNAPYPGSHVFQQPGTIFKIVQDIIGTILVTKFHEDQTINVAS
ncbi:hypothetical protein DPMN_079996 [Dreissena polymorpha]|uniref:Uncharacterized protein n=1 Tax=Dreissena polymorpha TaxID=45954 RepID=A0A9D3YU69_DREPO|nr:hypothetical protein DPMN_079996 [Dreissena polymorpha]